MKNKIKSILAVALFATYPTLSKFVLEHNSPAVVSFLTEILTGVLLLFSFGFLPEIKKFLHLRERKALWILISMGLLAGTVGPVAMQMGFAHSSVLNGVLLISLQSPLVIILSRIFLKEKIRANHIVGILAVIIGLVAYNTNLFSVRPHFSVYDSYFLLAAIAYSVSNIIYKKKISHVSHELALLIRNLFGGLMIFGAISLFSLESSVRVSFDAQSLIGIGLIVVIPILIAQSLWYSALEKIKSTEAAFFDALYPMFAAGIAFFARGESMTFEQIVGGAIMMGGILFSQIHWHGHPTAWHEVRLQHFKQH